MTIVNFDPGRETASIGWCSPFIASSLANCCRPEHACVLRACPRPRGHHRRVYDPPFSLSSPVICLRECEDVNGLGIWGRCEDVTLLPLRPAAEMKGNTATWAREAFMRCDRVSHEVRNLHLVQVVTIIPLNSRIRLSCIFTSSSSISKMPCINTVAKYCSSLIHIYKN
jgi:hypothetical protein